MRLELVSVALSFGASSVFWLVAAWLMELGVYGSVMQMQALLLLSSALFSLRTYDLVFHLGKHHGWPLGTAWRAALRVEIGLLLAGTTCCAVVLNWPGLAPAALGGNAAGYGLVLAVLANLPLLQGASAALLRGQHRDHDVAVAELCAFGAWAMALLVIWTAAPLTPRLLLISAFAAGAARPLALAALALRAYEEVSAPALAMDRRRIARYLLGGQLTNLLKNNLVAIETLLLGRVAGAEAVALYRVARSMLNLSTVLLNIGAQKAFRELPKAVTELARAATLRRLNREALIIYGCTLPVSFAVAWAFSRWHANGSYDDLVSTLAWSALAMLPLVLQQSQFAALSLDGGFSRIGAAYAGGLLLLVAGCLLLNPMPLIVFLIVVALAGSLRYALLRVLSRAQAKPSPSL